MTDDSSENGETNYVKLAFSYCVVGVVFIFEYLYSKVAPGLVSFESRMTKSLESISLCKKLIWGGMLNSCVLLYISHILVALREERERRNDSDTPDEI